MFIPTFFITFLALLPHTLCVNAPITILSSDETSLRQRGSAVPSILGKKPFAPKQIPQSSSPNIPGQKGLIKCESINHQWKECLLDRPIKEAGLREQLSVSPCKYARGYNIGYRSIIVDKGCRATFWYVTLPQPLKKVHYIRCDSFFKDFTNFKNKRCWIVGRVDEMFLYRSYSDEPCIVDYSWFQGTSSVYVKKGCKATFGYTLR